MKLRTRDIIFDSEDEDKDEKKKQMKKRNWYILYISYLYINSCFQIRKTKLTFSKFTKIKKFL